MVKKEAGLEPPGAGLSSGDKLVEYTDSPGEDDRHPISGVMFCYKDGSVTVTEEYGRATNIMLAMDENLPFDCCTMASVHLDSFSWKVAEEFCPFLGEFSADEVAGLIRSRCIEAVDGILSGLMEASYNERDSVSFHCRHDHTGLRD